MSNILAYGKLFSIAAYKARPASFSRLLSDAKGEAGYALCKCTDPAPKLVIRSMQTSTGQRNYLATWPKQGFEHDPHCHFFVSDGDYRDAKARRIAAPQANNDRFHQDDDESLRGILRRLWVHAGLNKARPNPGAGWGDVSARLEASVINGNVSKSSVADWIYVVPAFHMDRKDHIDATWMNFSQRFQGVPRDSRLFMMLGEIKSVEALDGSVVTLLRHHRSPLFMSNELGAVLAAAYPDVDRKLSDSEKPGRVLGLFQTEITSLGNLWISDASLMLVSEQYELLG